LLRTDGKVNVNFENTKAFFNLYSFEFSSGCHLHCP